MTHSIHRPSSMPIAICQCDIFYTTRAMLMARLYEARDSFASCTRAFKSASYRK